MKDYVRRIVQIFTSNLHDKATIKEVHQWLIDAEHADEKETALQELWAETEGIKTIDLHTSLNAVYNKVGVETTRKKSRYSLTITRYAAAVALLVASVSATYFITKSEYTEIAMVENYARAGEMICIDLPDGTKVQTNSGTLLLYPEKFTGDTRTVFLQGEANFKVKADPKKPFIVRSNTMLVTALGTEFNIEAYSEKNEIVATLLEGKVKVVCGLDGKNYILNPGQQVSFLKNTGESFLNEVDLNDVTAWQRGELIFRSVTVGEMIITLQRKYNVTVRYHQARFNDDKYNFRFSEKATLQEVLAVMKEVVGEFDVEIEGKICTIK